MRPKTKELIEVLGELAALLESDGDTHWSSWMLRAQSRLKHSEYSGVEYFLSAFGGMGSFNDIILGQCTQNGAFAWRPGYKKINEQFEKLRTKAWELATKIKSDHKKDK